MHRCYVGDAQSQELQVCLPEGSQAVDGVVHSSQSLGLCAWAAEPLIRVRTHLSCQVGAPRPLIGVHTHQRF